jgi:hypothetical protein
MNLLKPILLSLMLLLPGISMLSGTEVRFETLQAGERTYRDVRVRGISAQSVLIIHSGGAAQIPLRELSPELQERFGYDPERARIEEEELRSQRERKARQASLTRPEAPPVRGERAWKPEVDLRPRIFELGLHPKQQGRRPSCAVFAVLGALEFHHTLRQGRPVSLSEEFLVWATRQVNPGQVNFDGFTFAEVVTALRRYGVPRAELMTNLLGGPVDQLQPTPEALADALSRRNVTVGAAAGSSDTKIAAILDELNEGYPVVVSMAWPQYGGVHTLRDQPVRPGAGHAVTVVGYHRPSSNPDEILFLFRNSYGIEWGVAGHGFVSESYLRNNLWDVLILRVEAN